MISYIILISDLWHYNQMPEGFEIYVGLTASCLGVI